MANSSVFSEFMHQVKAETVKAGMPAGVVSIDQRDGYVSVQGDLGEIVLVVRVVADDNDRLSKYSLEYDVYLDNPGEPIQTFTYLDDASAHFVKLWEEVTECELCTEEDDFINPEDIPRGTRRLYADGGREHNPLVCEDHAERAYNASLPN